jgi:hypothetical protein
MLSGYDPGSSSEYYGGRPTGWRVVQQVPGNDEWYSLQVSSTRLTGASQYDYYNYYAGSLAYTAADCTGAKYVNWHACDDSYYYCDGTPPAPPLVQLPALSDDGRTAFYGRPAERQPLASVYVLSRLQGDQNDDLAGQCATGQAGQTLPGTVIGAPFDCSLGDYAYTCLNCCFPLSTGGGGGGKHAKNALRQANRLAARARSARAAGRARDANALPFVAQPAHEIDLSGLVPPFKLSR